MAVITNSMYRTWKSIRNMRKTMFTDLYSTGIVEIIVGIPLRCSNRSKILKVWRVLLRLCLMLFPALNHKSITFSLRSSDQQKVKSQNPIGLRSLYSQNWIKVNIQKPTLFHFLFHFHFLSIWHLQTIIQNSTTGSSQSLLFLRGKWQVKLTGGVPNVSWQTVCRRPLWPSLSGDTAWWLDQASGPYSPALLAGSAAVRLGRRCPGEPHRNTENERGRTDWE